jgi:soluble P-type ATPase
MLEIDIPGSGTLVLKHLVCDYNGTLACDGLILPEVADGFRSLAALLDIHVVTADTFGRAAGQLEGLPCRLAVLEPGNQDEAKREYVEALDCRHCVCIGNGRNDRLMLGRAALGIAVVLAEGACVETMTNADIVCRSIGDALGLLTETKRLVATLRA